MKDCANQDIQLGDLVVFKKGSRYTTMQLGRVAALSKLQMRLLYPTTGYGLVRKEIYAITGSMDPKNCFVVEREFVQPDLKLKLKEWSKLKLKNKDKKSLEKTLRMKESDIIMWCKTRCTPKEM
jgi:hypothetical protein